MSVTKAILFYSKHDGKSFKMKQLLDSAGADIDTISVDSSDVRERLLEDDKYGIDQVPAVLILYSSGEHKTYTNKSLDAWVEQLIQNIQQYYQQQSVSQQEVTALEPVDGVSKPLRRGPTVASNEMPSSLPPPGKPRYDSDPTDGLSSARAAMINEHIRGAEPRVQITSDPFVQPTRKEVKKDGVSAADLAKQMADQRDLYDEEVKANQPFI